MPETIESPLCKEHREYLRSYHDWLERGAPQEDPYRRDVGLCDNTKYYPSVKMSSFINAIGSMYPTLYPFGGEEQYDVEMMLNTMHLNEERIEFVKKHMSERIKS